MKKALAGLVLLFLVLGILGYRFGPALYQRFFPSALSGKESSAQARPDGANQRGVTPWGKITKIEAMHSLQVEGLPRPLEAEPGYQLWVVYVDPNTIPPPPATAEKLPASPEVFSRGNVEESFLVDTTGEKHAFQWTRLNVHSKAADGSGAAVFDTRVELILYAMPLDRQPRSLQFGDGSQLDLP